jgi:hypothetical protein
MNTKPHLLHPGKPGFSILILLALLLTNLSPVLAASTPGQTAKADMLFSLADVGEDDITARQIFEQFEIHFLLAEGQQIEQAMLNLHLEHGKKLLPEYSDLTIAINDEPVINLILDGSNAKAAYYPISIPVETLRPGQNTLLLRFNLRLRDSGCSDAGSPSMWAKVYADTNLEMEAIDVPIAPDLSASRRPFDTLSSLPGSPQLAFILPDRPVSAELTARASPAPGSGCRLERSAAACLDRQPGRKRGAQTI